MVESVLPPDLPFSSSSSESRSSLSHSPVPHRSSLCQYQEVKQATPREDRDLGVYRHPADCFRRPILHDLLNDPLLVSLLISFLPSSADVRALLVASLPPSLSSNESQDGSLSLSSTQTSSQASPGHVESPHLAAELRGYAACDKSPTEAVSWELENTEREDTQLLSLCDSSSATGTRTLHAEKKHLQDEEALDDRERSLRHIRSGSRPDSFSPSSFSSSSSFPSFSSSPCLSSSLSRSFVRLSPGTVACFYHSLCMRSAGFKERASASPRRGPEQPLSLQLSSGSSALSQQGKRLHSLALHRGDETASARHWREVYFSRIHGVCCEECGAELCRGKPGELRGPESCEQSPARTDRAGDTPAPQSDSSTSLELALIPTETHAEVHASGSASSEARVPVCGAFLSLSSSISLPAPSSACVHLCADCRQTLLPRREVAYTLARIVADVDVLVRSEMHANERGAAREGSRKRRREDLERGAGGRQSGDGEVRRLATRREPARGGADAREAAAMYIQKAGGGVVKLADDRKTCSWCYKTCDLLSQSMGEIVADLFLHGGLFVAKRKFRKLVKLHKQLVAALLHALRRQIRQELLQAVGFDFFRRVLAPLLENPSACFPASTESLDPAKERAETRRTRRETNTRCGGKTLGWRSTTGKEREPGPDTRQGGEARFSDEFRVLFHFSESEKQDLNLLLHRCFRGLAKPAVCTLHNVLGTVDAEAAGESEQKFQEAGDGLWELNSSALAGIKNVYATRTSFLLLVKRFHRLLEHPDLPLLHALYVQRVQTVDLIPLPVSASRRSVSPSHSASPASLVSWEEAQGENGRETEDQRKFGCERKDEGRGLQRDCRSGVFFTTLEGRTLTGLWHRKKDDVELVCCWRVLECICAFLFDRRSRKPVRCHRRTLEARQLIDQLYRLVQHPTAETESLFSLFVSVGESRSRQVLLPEENEADTRRLRLH
ncbi:UNVERIFIED_CONTAM: hypothetical protein HHA_244090 [Hammondia hammondi]|eukprot:XP_008884292.1 hypothetical protein HHA_244090 [Hammondia hammondi]